MNPSCMDLNADMGEGYGAYAMGEDMALMGIVSSINVACGFHAGDATIMRRLAEAASISGVCLGAHPGFNDLWGFGRRPMEMDAHDLENMVAYQIGALGGLAAFVGAKVRHVKPHGALYNMAAKREAYARAIVAAVKAVDTGLIVVGPPDSQMEKWAHEAGLRFAREGFCDRRYEDDGSLVSRSNPLAVIKDVDAAAAQALRLAGGEVATISGAVLPLEVDTLCIHGDEPGAEATARKVRAALEAEGVTVAPMLAV